MAIKALTRTQVDAVVSSQYARLRGDSLIGHLFAAIGPGGDHERKIADFWWAGLGGKLEHKRSFDMIGVHRALELDDSAFDRWFEHLQAALDQHLSPEQAAMWMARAQAIGANLKRFTLGGQLPSTLMRPGDRA